MILQIVRNCPSLEIEMRAKSSDVGARASGAFCSSTCKRILDMDREGRLFYNAAINAYALRLGTSLADWLGFVTLNSESVS